MEALAAAGASVDFVGRDQARCDAFAGRVRGLTLVADLSSMAEIRTLADEILRRRPRIDVAVNNAGAFVTQGGEPARPNLLAPKGSARYDAVRHGLRDYPMPRLTPK